MRRLFLFPCCACLLAVACAPLPSRVVREAVTPATTVVGGPESPQSWFGNGAATAQANLAGPARARNVIVFLGDGMSIPTITAARILDGQRKGGTGEENRLAFEQFPATALSRTYETDYQTPDSAGTMTAIMSGVKTRDGVIGIDQQPLRGDCAASRGHELVNLFELAEAAGLATGVVTTARVTHATPAATYGHLPERDWEDDSTLTAAAREQGCTDFALQLVEFPIGDGIDVVLGGGRRGFIPVRQSDPEYPDKAGRRKDGRDLIAEWRQRSGGTYVWNTRGLEAVEPARTRKLLGLFEPGHMRYEHERAADPGGEPDLAQMTRTALAVLERNPRGYVLMVEAGRIDHAHHAGNAYRALEETIGLSRAVQAAVEATSADDTLILVTADHSHTLSFAGYPARGNPILGKVRHADGALALDAAGLPYTALGYANGPGHAGASDVQPEGIKRYPHEPDHQAYAKDGRRPDLSQVDTTDPDFMQEAGMPSGSESHGGDDVAVYALGPGADGVRGSLEQNVLFHLMAQSTPALRDALCALGACDASGMPVRRPDYAALPRRHSR
jgi:alkaline phosphatase